jgi:hypothetical protein
LAAVLSKMVRYDYRDRYQSVDEVRQALAQLTSYFPPTQLPSTPPLPVAPTQALPLPPSEHYTPPVAATSSNKLPLLLVMAGIAGAVGVAVAIASIKTAPPLVGQSPDSTPKVAASVQTSPSPNSTPSITSSPLNTTPVTSLNEFDKAQFPQTNCGDPPQTNSASQTQFYPVFIEYSENNLQTLKARFCTDAYKTNRKDSGELAIQVASFNNRGRAESFSSFMKRKLGSGDVGQPTITSVNSSPGTPSPNNCPIVASDPTPPLNVRATPKVTSDNQNVVGTIENGTPLTIVTEQNGWLQISSPVQGWVSKQRTKTVCPKSANLNGE